MNPTQRKQRLAATAYGLIATADAEIVACDRRAGAVTSRSRANYWRHHAALWRRHGDHLRAIATRHGVDMRPESYVAPE